MAGKKKPEIEFVEEEVEIETKKPTKGSLAAKAKAKDDPVDVPADEVKGHAAKKAPKIVQIILSPPGMTIDTMDEETGTTSSEEVVVLGLQDDGSIVRVSVNELL